MSQCHFSIQNRYLYLKKKKKFPSLSKNIDHCARRNQIEEIQDPPDFKGGSRDSKFFEFPEDTKLMVKKCD